MLPAWAPPAALCACSWVRTSRSRRFNWSIDACSSSVGSSEAAALSPGAVALSPGAVVARLTSAGGGWLRARRSARDPK
jgi:hypothetical protein